MNKICLQCKNPFTKRKDYSLAYWITAKFCSRKCKNLSMIGSSGFWTGKIRYYKNPLGRSSKISETMKGKRPIWLDYQKNENHPCWKDGRSKTKEYKAYCDSKRKFAKKANGGSYGFKDWENLKEKYNFICPACYKSEPEIKLTVDHVIPLSKGGSNDISNLQPLCFMCNTRKSTKIIKYEICQNEMSWLNI